MRWSLLLLSCFFLTSCFQASSSDADLRAVPVTNNPHVLPPGAGPALIPR